MYCIDDPEADKNKKVPLLGKYVKQHLVRNRSKLTGERVENTVNACLIHQAKDQVRAVS